MAITIVSGVSGSGKSTVAQVLLRHIGQQGSFIDADDFWTGTAAKQKMQEGQPLTDEDRWPWLEALAQEAVKHLHTGESTVVIACSVLKRRYRSFMTRRCAELEAAAAAAAAGAECPSKLHGKADQNPGRPPRYVLLDPPYQVLHQQVATRAQHFMPASLLDSQLQAFEAAGDFTLCVTGSAPSPQPSTPPPPCSNAATAQGSQVSPLLVSNGAITKGSAFFVPVMNDSAGEHHQEGFPLDSTVSFGTLQLPDHSLIDCVMYRDPFPDAQRVAADIASRLI